MCEIETTKSGNGKILSFLGKKNFSRGNLYEMFNFNGRSMTGYLLSFFVLLLVNIPYIEAAEGDFALIVSVNPSEAGQVEPSGTVSATPDTPLQLTAEANLGWQFKQWTCEETDAVTFYDEDDAVTFVVASKDATISAIFEQCATYAVSVSVYPEGAGTTTVSASQVNATGCVELTAFENSPDSVFYKWTCSEGAEILDSESPNTMLRLVSGAAPSSVEVTAHYLTLDDETGTISMSSSFKGNISGLSLLRKNRASVKATLPANLTGITLDKNTQFAMELGDRNTPGVTHFFSDDPKLKIKEDAGSASFTHYVLGDDKKCGGLTIKWKKGRFLVQYSIVPPSDHNILNLYSSIYKNESGKSIAVNSDKFGSMPAAITLEGSDWCMMWVSKGGVSYTGKGSSVPAKKIEDDIVSWKASGQGTLAHYTWKAPEFGKTRSATNSIRLRRSSSLALRAAKNAVGRDAVRQRGTPPSPEFIGNYNLWSTALFSNILYCPSTSVYAPFLFKGKVYAMHKVHYRFATNQAAMSVMKVSDSTNPKADGLFYDNMYPLMIGNKDYPYGAATRITTCVFKGFVYLFYDNKDADGKNFHVIAAKSEFPEAQWETLGKLSGVSGGYAKQWDYEALAPLKALVFNNKIYLICYTGDGCYQAYSSENGTTWQTAFTLNDAQTWGDKYRGRMNACVVTRNAEPMICVAVLGTDKYNSHMYLRYFDVDDKLRGGSHHYMDWVNHKLGFGISAGTLDGATPGQNVQIFALNSVWWGHKLVRHCSVNVESGAFEGWWDMPVWVWTGDNYNCETVEYTVPVRDAAGNQSSTEAQRKIVCFTPNSNVGLSAAVFKSDRLKVNGDKKTLDTVVSKYRNIASWTLLGVIHGCPPFTRNGNNIDKSLSEISYSRVKENSSGTDFEFESEAEVELAGTLEKKNKKTDSSIGGEIGLNIKLQQSNAWGSKHKVKLTGKSTLYTVEDNKDGNIGHLVYAMPTISSQPYVIESADGKMRLLSYKSVTVDSVSVSYIPFKLDAPPEGMVKLRPTSDLIYWNNERPEFPYDPSTVSVQSKQMRITTSSDDEGSFKTEWTNFFKTGGSLSITVSASAEASKILGLRGEASFGFTFSTNYSQSQSCEDGVSFSLARLPAAASTASPKIKELGVNAYFYAPSPSVDLQKIDKPDWVPTSCYKNQTTVPWLLTWKVVDIMAE